MAALKGFEMGFYLVVKTADQKVDEKVDKQVAWTDF
jgi:hypothetical protein